MKEALILASASPRRKELLEQIGLTFEICPARGEEVIKGENPKEIVMELSRQKAVEVGEQWTKEGDYIVLGADTVVVKDDKILGKPKNEEEATEMIRLLSGDTHQVFTGVTFYISSNGERKVHSFYDRTQVVMYPMTEQEIAYYISTKEYQDKAGGYGIQGKCAPFIQKIDGDYNNVVGLPVAKVYQEFLKLGIDIYEHSL